MIHARARFGSFAVLLAALAAAVAADSGANHQTSSEEYGTSGGNANDISRVFCCSGTLGSLVTDGTSLYILSNNHVLARSDQASVGEDVSQPGLVDNSCQAGEIVADLAPYPAVVTSNVDAAVATLRPGAMSSAGAIMDIGVPAATTTAPFVGLAVAKSGRTTGFTTGTIGAIDVNVRIQYQVQCGIGQRFTVIFVNQFIVDTASFSAGGDSGSLILTDDTSHSPVGLLFAGSSSLSIGNPIDEVLARVGEAIGTSVSFNLGGGGGGGGSGGGGRGRGRGSSQGSVLVAPGVPNLNAAEVARGMRAKQNHAGRLMQDPAVLGVGVGEDPAVPGQAAVVVYLQRGASRAGIARDLDGVPTRIVETDPFVASGWNEPLGGSCKVRSE